MDILINFIVCEFTDFGGGIEANQSERGYDEITHV